MREVEITIHLPEALAHEAKRLGILSSEHIAALIQAEILEAQLSTIANDPEIMRELTAIAEEFSITEGDGLDDES